LIDLVPTAEKVKSSLMDNSLEIVRIIKELQSFNGGQMAALFF